MCSLQSPLRTASPLLLVSPIDNTTNYTLHCPNHSLTLARLSCPRCYTSRCSTASPKRRSLFSQNASRVHARRSVDPHAMYSVLLLPWDTTRLGPSKTSNRSWTDASLFNLVRHTLPIAFPNQPLPQHTNFPLHLHTHTQHNLRLPAPVINPRSMHVAAVLCNDGKADVGNGNRRQLHLPCPGRCTSSCVVRVCTIVLNRLHCFDLLCLH
jgi:hypothetical protein